MNKRLLSLLLLFPVKLFAQQLPQYTQYTFNELLINPAVAGIETYWDIKTGYRSQWTGLQSAPTTGYFTVSIPLNKEFTEGNYGQIIRNTDNPIGRTDRDSYQASFNHGGISLSLVGDKSGAFNQTHFNTGYAYHLMVNDQFNLAVGASVGFNNISLNVSQLTFNNPIDPAVSQGGNGQFKPDAAVGMWGYGPAFFIGASAQQLIPQDLSFNSKPSGNQSKIPTQYFFTLGFKVYPSDDVTLLPSVVVNPSANTPINLDVNVKIAFRDIFWFGGAYRKNDAITSSVGFNIGALFTVGYAYDYSISDLSAVNKGTHEIMLGVLLHNKYNVTTARHTW
ncbi:type IX secretion system membrane protein PorP/SprF [Mucilaginibacter sp. AW1-3]